MSIPAFVKGQFFSVAVDPEGDGTFVTVCGMTTREFAETVQTSDNYYRDCADPSMVPVRSLNVTGISASITGNATYNRAQADTMRNLIGRPVTTRFVAGEDANDPVDSGYYEGKFVLTSRNISAPDGADVTSALTWQNDGPYPWVPGADIIVLDPLSLSPKTATHAVAYTGTVTGATTGSTLAAVASDGTALTVTGTGNTRTISGTFTNAGNVTVTLTETLTSAPNTGKKTTVIVAVA